MNLKTVVDPVKAAALRLAKQAGAAREYALLKAARRPNREKNTAPKYERGSVGLSQVSQSILDDHGAILSRRERKALAKEQGVPFKAYYNQ